jgi:hypothetical protein
MHSFLRRRRPTRAAGLVALALVVLATLAPPPAPAAARRPWTPAPPSRAYTPRHVWQTRDNCVFASGQMLIDKWTHGRVRASQGRLRAASKDEEGGAGFRDLAKGIAGATGIRLRWSPSGGDPMTWWQLLDRLEHHGGAVLFGEYGRFPAAYRRWAPKFARSANDNHAVYVERYDRAKGRVWLMDPLAAGGFKGEWIDVEALRRFASFDGSLVKAAATPARKRPKTAPLVDQAYRLGAPVFAPVIVAGATTDVSVPMTIADGFPLPAAHALTGTWERIGDALGELARDDTVVIPAEAAPDALHVSALQPPASTLTRSPDARPSASGFRFGLPTPEHPGNYRLTLALVAAGAPADRPARSIEPVEVRVVGPFAGSIALTAAASAQVGSLVRVQVAVANLGIVDWRPAAPPATGAGLGIEVLPGHPAVLTVSWRSASGGTYPAPTVDLPLSPGTSSELELDIPAPSTAGAWVLEADVVHPAAGSLAAGGMTATPVSIVVNPPSADPTP